MIRTENSAKARFNASEKMTKLFGEVLAEMGLKYEDGTVDGVRFRVHTKSRGDGYLSRHSEYTVFLEACISGYDIHFNQREVTVSRKVLDVNGSFNTKGLKDRIKEVVEKAMYHQKATDEHNAWEENSRIAKQELTQELDSLGLPNGKYDSDYNVKDTSITVYGSLEQPRISVSLTNLDIETYTKVVELMKERENG